MTEQERQEQERQEQHQERQEQHRERQQWQWWRWAAIGLFLIAVIGNGIMLALFQAEQQKLDRIVEQNAQRTISFCEDRNRENQVIAEIMGGLADAFEADGNPQSAAVLRDPPEGFGSRPVECADAAIVQELNE